MITFAIEYIILMCYNGVKMSTSLYYEFPKDKIFLGYRLKFFLAPVLWDHDGSCHGKPIHVDKRIYPILNKVIKSNDNELGLRDSAIKLKKLIRKHKHILLSLEG